MMLAPQRGRHWQETYHPAAHGRPPVTLERAVVFWVRPPRTVTISLSRRGEGGPQGGG
jgi:hypothetical protein